MVEIWGKPPEEIKENLPHLSLAQIFDALGYYDEHREEIETFIKENESIKEINDA